MAQKELSRDFLAYDVDDGRSSKMHQNEEDEKYFGQLECELRAKSICILLLIIISIIFAKIFQFKQSTKKIRIKCEKS
jgi:hypothetical protein